MTLCAVSPETPSPAPTALVGPDRLHASADRPRLGVVVVARPGARAPVALDCLRRTGIWQGASDIVLARGTSPAAQRNAAARVLRGELILFLDDDSQPRADLLERYAELFHRYPELGAAGGPAVDAAPSGVVRRAATALFSDRWVVGSTAARYAPHGEARWSDERELILCNLCVRRTAFEDAGGFDEAMYPSEENELLERLALLGWRLAYVPEACVERAQRDRVADLVVSAGRYGRGRGSQLRRRASRPSARRLALAFAALVGAVLSAGGLGTGEPWLLAPALGYALYTLGAGARVARRQRAVAGLLGACLVPMVHAAHALGILWGVVSPLSRPPSTVSLERPRSRALAALGMLAALCFHTAVAHAAGEGARVEYRLPFAPGTTQRVLFGPGDAPHHVSPRNRYAYDFAMPMGTPVSAAAGGVVVFVEGRFSGPTGRSRENNFVAIRHAGGEVSEYHHLMQGGVLVRRGEKVERGEVIGFSGASGRAEGPHLHFVVVRGEESVPVSFGELASAPKRGARCASENVPARVAERYEDLRKRVTAARGLLRRGSRDAARVVLGNSAVRISPAQRKPSASERRAQMALRPLEATLAQLRRELDVPAVEDKPQETGE